MLYLYVSRRLCICIHLQKKNSKKVGTNVSVHAYQRNWIKLPCNLNLKVIFKFYLLLLFHCFRSMPFFDFAIIPHTLRLLCFYCCFCLVCTFGKDLDFYLLTLFFLLFLVACWLFCRFFFSLFYFFCCCRRCGANFCSLQHLPVHVTKHSLRHARGYTLHLLPPHRNSCCQRFVSPAPPNATSPLAYFVCLELCLLRRKYKWKSYISAYRDWKV